MSREIKFRSWNSFTKRMIDLKAITPLALSLDTDGLFIPFSDGLPLMQFIGRKDINGKDVYEGDIVKGWVSRYPDSKTTGWIEYNKHDQAFQLRYENCFDGHASEFTHRYHFFEVIGNVYENPNLMKTDHELSKIFG